MPTASQSISLVLVAGSREEKNMNVNAEVTNDEKKQVLAQKLEKNAKEAEMTRSQMESLQFMVVEEHMSGGSTALDKPQPSNDAQDGPNTIEHFIQNCHKMSAKSCVKCLRRCDPAQRTLSHKHLLTPTTARQVRDKCEDMTRALCQMTDDSGEWHGLTTRRRIQ